MNNPSPLLRLPAVMLAVALLAAACGTSAPTPVVGTPSPSASAPQPTASPSGTASPVPSGNLDGLLGRIEEAVRELRGLDERTPVEPEIIDGERLTEYVKQTFNEDNPPEYVAAYGRMLEHLGLVPADSDLGALFIELLSSQVIGLYNYDDATLFVVSEGGAFGPFEQVTYAHEYTHALQDQHFDTDRLQLDELDEGDRAMARVALVEGDATLLMSLWAQGALTPEEILEVVNQSDPGQDAVLEKMPAILRETLFFPYTAGLNYVVGIQTTGGWDAVDAKFTDLPESTEQILHPEKADEAPIDVTFPADLAARLGAGWTNVLEDTLGEFQLGIWAREAGGLGAVSSSNAAAGWGGDRVVLLEGPDGASAVVVDTEWDNPAEAAEFREAASAIERTLDEAGYRAAVLGQDDTSVTIVIASSDDVLGRVANVLGLAG